MSIRSRFVYSIRKYCIPAFMLKALRSSLRKHKAIRRKRKKVLAIDSHGVFATKELLQIFRELDIQEGDNLFVQCSFNDLYTFDGTPMDLLNCLKTAVGASGTLLFPVYTDVSKLKKDKPVDLDFQPTYTGIVNEIFRRSPDVVRSLHPRHSICGYGPLAEELLKDHHKCKYADGVGSPFDKMRKLKTSKILTLGLPPCYISFLHWVEDIEPHNLPFPIHKVEPEKYTLLLADGSLFSIEDFVIDRSIFRLTLPRTCNKLSADAARLTEHKGIQMNIYMMAPLADELLKLRDQNIIHYQ